MTQWALVFCSAKAGFFLSCCSMPRGKHQRLLRWPYMHSFSLSKTKSVTRSLEFMRTPIWLGSCVSQEEEQREEKLIWLEEWEELHRETKWGEKTNRQKKERVKEQERKQVIERGTERYPEDETRDVSEVSESSIKTSLTASLKGALCREGLTSPSPSHVVGHTKLQLWQRRWVLFLQPTAVSVMTFRTKTSR